MTTADGLPSNRIYGVAFGPDGMPWVHTERGIARQDGARWALASDVDGFGGPVDGRGTIASSPRGGLWFGAFDEGPGLARLGVAGWTHYPAATGPLAFDVVGVRRGPDGAIWLSYANRGRFRVNRVVGNTWESMMSDEYESPPKPYVGMRTLQRAAMAFDPTHRLWLGSIHQDQGVATFDRTDETWTRTKQPGDLPGTLVWDLAFEPSGNGWFATDAGIARIVRGAVQVLDDVNGLPSEGIQSIEVSLDGTVWVASRAGVARWDGDGVGWRAYAVPPEYSIVGHTLEIGPDGTVWATGVQRSGESDVQYLLCALRNGSWSIVERLETLDAFAIAPDGELWVAGDDRVGRLKMGRWTWYEAPDDLQLTGVHDLAIAGDGTLWMAAWAHAIGVAAQFRPPESDRTPRVYLPWAGW